MTKGFIATLESVIAATIFLIFIINVLPGITGAEVGQGLLQQRASSILTAMDNAGKLHPAVLEGDPARIEQQISPYLAGINTAVGLAYTNITEGSYSGGIVTRNFSVNETIVREQTLVAHVTAADSLEIDVNGENVVSTSSSGIIRRDISTDTEGGHNTLNISATAARLQYAVHIRNYRQHGRLPAEGDIIAVTYPIAGANTTMQPSELRVFMWR